MVNTPSPGVPQIGIEGGKGHVFDGVHIGNGGTGIRATNAEFTANDLRVANVGTGLHVTGQSAATILDTQIERAYKAGMRIEDSSTYIRGSQVGSSNVGIDFGPRSKGGLRKSQIVGNDVDIRYHKDVMIHVFRTTARYILDRTKDRTGIRSVNKGWICHRIIWTTDLGDMARGIKKLIRAGAIKTAGGQLASLAAHLAGFVLGKRG